MQKYCKNCGSELTEGSAFCYTCGAKVESSIIVKNNVESQNIHHDSSFDKFKKFTSSKFDKVKESAFTISKSTKDFAENTSNVISSKFDETNYVTLEKYSYSDSLSYIQENKYSLIQFPASDEETKNKLRKLLSGEVIGGGAGLVGAAASIGLIGSTLGAGLIIVGAGALIGGVIASNYANMSWVSTKLFIYDDELVFAGKFSLPYSEIKHVDVKMHQEDELVVLTLKKQSIEFRTYNANALKTVIQEKLDVYYKK